MQQQLPRRGSLGEGELAEAPPQLPLSDGRYFACRRCRRILSEAQWFSTGCVECSATMGKPDRDSLLDFATPHFHNFIGLIAPEQSWVARLIMKSRAQTNGVFAEMLSDDESEGEAEFNGLGEEEEEEMMEGEEEGDAREGAAAPAAVEDADDLYDDEDFAKAFKTPAVSSAPMEEPSAAATAVANNDEVEERELKRVKREAAETPAEPSDAPREEDDA